MFISRYALIWACLLGLGWVRTAYALTPTADLQGRVRAGTFEVVIRKAEQDPLKYEKPLPLELIPYLIRNDKYWSMGTAFAVAPGTFVSAGHVLLQGVGSQLGDMALRDSAGHVYPVDKVLKFSLNRDYMVFTVTGTPAVTPLEVNRAAAIDQPVFAVGNALGEGVVIRDGLLTSKTPEPLEGAWNWLRFSAAASPGNSGGPLLDADGRVLGVIEAKSENENLNYALPIAEVLDAAQKAEFIARGTSRLPNLSATEVANLNTSFALPLSYPEFARNYLRTINRYLDEQREGLLKRHAEELFPRGESARLLGTTVVDRQLPTLIAQDEDKIWGAPEPSELQSTDLPGNGKTIVGASAGVAVLRILRPDRAADVDYYSKPGAFADQLLKGFKLYRTVGADRVRVTSLGAVERDEAFADGYGRHWQLRVWPLAYTDAYLVTLALPVPDGYVGLVQNASGQNLQSVVNVLEYAAHYVLVSYQGTIAQWRAYLGLKKLRPEIFDQLQLSLETATGLAFRSSRLQFAVTPRVQPLTDRSKLRLDLNYLLHEGKLSWDVAGLALYQDADRNTYVSVTRHTRPEAAADADRQRRWTEMSTHTGAWSGAPGHDTNFENFWIATTRLAPANDVLYALSVNIERDALPRELTEIEHELGKGLQVTEH